MKTSSKKGRLTERTNELIDVQAKNWKLEEINMNKILKLKNCIGNSELIACLQDKNFFDLFNYSNGFAINVEDNVSLESVKQLLETRIKKAVLI